MVMIVLHVILDINATDAVDVQKDFDAVVAAVVVCTGFFGGICLHYWTQDTALNRRTHTRTHMHAKSERDTYTPWCLTDAAPWWHLLQFHLPQTAVAAHYALCVAHCLKAVIAGQTSFFLWSIFWASLTLACEYMCVCVCCFFMCK